MDDKTKNKQTILLIDGYHLLHKGYYGSLKRKKVATNRDGVKINAIYTFISKINEIIDLNIYHTVIVTFDVGQGCWRRDLYPLYKANRKETPADLIPQMQIIRTFLSQAHIPWYEKENFEGDDVMGTIARIAVKKGYNVHILSNDKDCYQLINPNVKVVVKSTRNTPSSFIDENVVEDKMGCSPSQVADIKALMGDSSDNIKGVRYLNYQTALRLLAEYDTAENIVAHVNDLPKNVHFKIKNAQEQILMNKKITTIGKNLDLGRIDFRPLRVNWRGYINFLKKNKMWAYLPYAEERLDQSLKAIPKKSKKPKGVKFNNSKTMPLSCNSPADEFVFKMSDYEIKTPNKY